MEFVAEVTKGSVSVVPSSKQWQLCASASSSSLFVSAKPMFHWMFFSSIFGVAFPLLAWSLPPRCTLVEFYNIHSFAEQKHKTK